MIYAPPPLRHHIALLPMAPVFPTSPAACLPGRIETLM
jgi:hypothetical protein